MPTTAHEAPDHRCPDRPGYSPTEAGLLTVPMMAGVLGASIVSGRLITRTGRIKPYIVAGAAALVVGFLALGQIDHETSLVLVGGAMLFVGVVAALPLKPITLRTSLDLPDTDRMPVEAGR